MKDWKKYDLVLEGLGLYLFGQEYSEEIKGAYSTVQRLGLEDKVTHGMLVFFQMFYELLMECTGIVAQDPNGQVTHGRNMDIGLAVPNITGQVTWVKDGKNVLITTQYLGYFGVHTGMRLGGWSVQANERVVLEFGPWGYTKSIIASDILALLKKHETVGFMLREALLAHETMDEAVAALAAKPSVSPLYFILAGSQPGEGAVVTKNREGLAHSPHGESILRLNESSSFYLAQTNWDNWLPISSAQCKGGMAQLPAYVETACEKVIKLTYGVTGHCDTLCQLTSDGRAEAAKAAMDMLASEDVGDDSIVKVLSTPPVYAGDTQITALMHPATGDYTTIVREHNGQPRKQSPGPAKERLLQELFHGLIEFGQKNEIIV